MVLVIFLYGQSTATAAKITDIRPIVLHAGVNEVPDFAPDGGTITIVQAWRGNGNAHGYNTWMVLSSNAEGQSFGIVGIERSDTRQLEEIVRDNPFDGERIIGVVRFAKARVDGADQSILIEASLDAEPGRAFADHEPVTVRIYQLFRTDGAPGSTPDVFKPILTMQETRRFCNADLALHQILDLPLAPDYAGPNQVDGCFDNR
jgi:hypothetical protein